MTQAPVRTPAGSAKSLQLTPIWEEVVRNQRVPPDVALSEVLREIRGRLCAGEWEVRQHALRVLSDVLPVAGKLAEAADMQAALVANLGSPAPGVRKAAREALGKLFKQIDNPEPDILELLGSCSDENVTLGIIIALPDLLKPLILPPNGGYSLTSYCLTKILTYLVNRVSTPIYRDASVASLMKIREMSGEIKFQKCLDDISPDPKTLQLLTLNLDDSGIDLKLPIHYDDKQEQIKSDPSWSDGSDADYEEALLNSVTTFHNYDCLKSKASSEETASDGSEDTYTMESTESGKLVLETEIKLSEEKAITMRIMEDDSHELEDGVDERFVSADGALVMEVVPSSDEDARRTPRRVRFGGEVVKLCTPDSDATDVRIEIHDATLHTVERLVIEKQHLKASQIPLPITPATTLPQAPSESPRLQTINQNLPSIKVDSVDDDEPSQSTLSSEPCENGFQSFDSSPPDVERPKTASRDRSSSSSSGSTGSVPPHEIVPEFPLNQWPWQSLGLLNDSDLNILRNKNDWKEELAVLEQLPRNLLAGDMQERLRNASHDTLQSLLRYLLENSRQQTAEAALIAVGQILNGLTNSSVQACMSELVSGICRHVGCSSPIAARMAAASLLKFLFSSQLPNDILDALLSQKCLHSPSSKMRENSLLVLLHSLMTYPSTTFPVRRLLDEACQSLADPRRRVRHAALETIAVLAQFLSAKDIIECASKYGDSRLVTAATARLTRRSLPSVSADGLVLYALQIPAARRLGNTGPPQGADVNWILAGTGSLSTGSARSRGQLQAAQSSRWGADSNVVRKASRENPWTAQKNRTEDALAWALVPVSNVVSAATCPNENAFPNSMPHCAATCITTDPFVTELDLRGFESRLYFSYHSHSLHSPSVTVAMKAEHRYTFFVFRNSLVLLVPKKSPEIYPTTTEMLLCKIVGYRPFLLSNIKDDGGYAGEGGYLNLRPLYVKLATTEDAIRSQHYAVHRVADASSMEASIRVLTPSALRKRPETKTSPWTDIRSRETEPSELRKNERFSGRKLTEPPRAVLVPGTMNHATTPPTALFLPNIHSQEKPAFPNPPPKTPTEKPRFSEPTTPVQRVNIATAHLLSQSLPAVRPESTLSVKQPSVESVDVISLSNEVQESQDKLFCARERDTNLEQRVSMASAPAAIPTSTRETSTSSSGSNSSQPAISDAVDGQLMVSSISYRSLNESYNQKVKAKRKTHTNGDSAPKTAECGPKFPDTLKSFERVKEGLDTCFHQLEAQQWEVTIQGLSSLVRLIRHHPSAVSAHIHPLAVALAKQIRNLRSQVSRAACVVASEMFTLMKRTVEPELEELSVALFSRVADTNRFIRADSNAALDAMVDTMAPNKSIPVILLKGAAHLNAVARTSAARLLLRLTERLGPEKILSLPKDIRDKMLQASAGLLTEGRLETRSFAKQLFRIWSTYPQFGGIIHEAISANIMRQISKTLASFRA